MHNIWSKFAMYQILKNNRTISRNRSVTGLTAVKWIARTRFSYEEQAGIAFPLAKTQLDSSRDQRGLQRHVKVTSFDGQGHRRMGRGLVCPLVKLTFLRSYKCKEFFLFFQMRLISADERTIVERKYEGLNITWQNSKIRNSSAGNYYSIFNADFIPHCQILNLHRILLQLNRLDFDSDLNCSKPWTEKEFLLADMWVSSGVVCVECTERLANWGDHSHTYEGRQERKKPPCRSNWTKAVTLHTKLFTLQQIWEILEVH